MSRIGKKSITIPEGVEVHIKGNNISVKGPKGSLNLDFDPRIKVRKSDKEVTVSPVKEGSVDKELNSLWGLTRNLVNNIIIGVTRGHRKELEIQGVGYRAKVQGNKLVLEVGFSHPVEYKIPEGIDLKAEKNTVLVEGIDKQKVGQVAAEIRAVRPPEPYKGKGIRYVDEYVRRKVGKKAVAEEGTT